jgi:hypothetical protein
MNVFLWIAAVIYGLSLLLLVWDGITSWEIERRNKKLGRLVIVIYLSSNESYCDMLFVWTKNENVKNISWFNLDEPSYLP